MTDTRKPRFHIRQSKDGTWYVTLYAANNRVLFSARGYNTQAGARNAIDDIIRNVFDAAKEHTK